ncbi:thioesterase [Endozoicomonas sp. OPT23]|uniref:acyl-CoA thioesterase n=1 Tax=Endozoicomonas sp. OPT23 TaxID=2072845 RepID=UPI00129A36DF|nr:thioesterase family protein [Endozoicomonas sp. OPT23]MRI33204.1 thioesterase [Endozoicomonas sp. OPT23]
MLQETITPRFCETDALGHINNTVVPEWFEHARTPIFKMFTPDLDTNNWKLIIARIEVEYTAQLQYNSDVILKTCLEKVGNSSMYIHHEAWQNDVLAARGKAVLIHYDYENECSSPIPDSIRQKLMEHLQR